MKKITGYDIPEEGFLAMEVGFTLLEKGKIKEFNKLRTELDWRPNLEGKDLGDLNLTRVDLSGVNLRGANLHKANLYMAILTMADLAGANICMANLIGANLVGANLRGAKLRKANLYTAILTGADLRGADLTGANICMTNLTGVNLAGARGIISIGPIGSRGDILYVVWHPKSPMIMTGCFWGTLAEFEEKVKHHHDKEAGEKYNALIPFIKSWWENNSEV